MATTTKYSKDGGKDGGDKKPGNTLGKRSTSDDNAQAGAIAFKRGGKVPAKGMDKMSPKMKAFEKSKADNDRGVKEGSKADMKRDKREMKAMGKHK